MTKTNTPVLALGALLALGAVSVAVPASAANVMQTPGAQWPADQDESSDWLMAMPGTVFNKLGAGDRRQEERHQYGLRLPHQSVTAHAHLSGVPLPRRQALGDRRRQALRQWGSQSS
jgi:hypothetical protein